MDPGQIAEQLPALLGAGAGAAAKGAAGGAGRAAFERLRERLRRERPADADRLERVLAELQALSDSMGSLADASDDLHRAMEDLAANIEVRVVAGSKLVNYGHIDRSVVARDVNVIDMG